MSILSYDFKNQKYGSFPYSLHRKFYIFLCALFTITFLKEIMHLLDCIPATVISWF